MTVKDLIDRVSRDLIDPKNTRWTRPELVDYLNDAIAAIVLRRPDLSRTTKTTAITTNTLTLLDDTYQLLGVNHIGNVAVQYVDINTLNQLYPDWRTKTGVPECWTRNELDETTLFVYPTPTAQVDIEYIYSRHLAVAAETDPLPLPDIYQGVLVSYMLHKAYSKDGQAASEQNKAQIHYQAFATVLGEKATADSVKAQILKAGERGR